MAAHCVQLAAAVCAGSLLAVTGVAADLYQYRDESGATVYSDRPPADERAFERRAAPAAVAPPQVNIRLAHVDARLELYADNGCYCPVEVALQLTGGSYADVVPGAGVREVIPARGAARLISLRPTGAGADPRFRFGFVLGDPAAVHTPTEGYRPPFAAGRRFLVTQAYPDAMTHVTPDSRYAIDIAMPERTDVYAARGGIVVDAAYRNFRGGADFGKYGAEANVVRILHDDGSFAIYAHLSWDSLRVRPGDRVARGEVIAASGNTGFSTGPHLHFAVVRNDGLRTTSVPVVFSDGRDGLVTARSGQPLRIP